jgi:uncharacterized protein
MREAEAVTFRDAAGRVIFGMLHSPDRPDPQRPAIVLMSPGVKMRVGPGRLYIPFTEMLTEMGYTVFRVDFHGLGDAEGELTETLLADLYNHVEVGRHVGDVACALEWLRHERGVSHFIAGGLCGGAVTALLAAERDPRIVGLLAIGIPVTLASSVARPPKSMTRVELADWRRLYVRKLFDPKAWWRLLTLQSELGVIARSLLVMVQPERKPAPVPQGNTLTPEQMSNINPLFAPAFLTFLERGGRALLLFSEKDRMYAEYQEKFLALHGARLRTFGAQVREHVIAGANHVLTQPEWREEMLAVSRSWLTGAPGD